MRFLTICFGVFFGLLAQAADVPITGQAEKGRRVGCAMQKSEGPLCHIKALQGSTDLLSAGSFKNVISPGAVAMLEVYCEGEENPRDCELTALSGIDFATAMAKGSAIGELQLPPKVRVVFVQEGEQLASGFPYTASPHPIQDNGGLGFLSLSPFFGRTW